MKAKLALMTSISAELPATGQADFARVRAQLRDAVERDDAEAIHALLAPFHADIDKPGVSELGISELVLRRDRMGRLIEWMDGFERTPGSACALSALYIIDDLLDRARIRARALQAQEQREGQESTVRGRVLQLISEGKLQQPGELAKHLEVDSTQVSRAIRQLVDSGQLVLVPGTPGGDGRARRYGVHKPEVPAKEPKAGRPSRRRAPAAALR
jgi:hypothetical protein